MSEYLLDEDYEIAKQNGISKSTAYQRFYLFGWTKEDTLFKPVKPNKGLWTDRKEKAVVCAGTFYSRLQLGWTPDEAAYTPSVSPSAPRNGKITPEDYAKAEANGISKDALVSRIYVLKWNMEKATTTPTRSKKSRDKSKQALALWGL